VLDVTKSSFDLFFAFSPPPCLVFRETEEAREFSISIAIVRCKSEEGAREISVSIAIVRCSSEKN
jgi:hypothetical protein